MVLIRCGLAACGAWQVALRSDDQCGYIMDKPYLQIVDSLPDATFAIDATGTWSRGTQRWKG
jgi:hypothetical protein